MTDAELMTALAYLRDTLISVATGGPRIDDVNGQFQQTYLEVASALKDRGIQNPIPFDDLWSWYGRWSSGDLPSYKSRRIFVADIFNPILTRMRTGQAVDFEPTGWARVDRVVGKLRNQLAAAVNEEEFQQIGLLCREVLISAGQAVYDPARHTTLDGIEPSTTDAKRMIEAFIAAELAGSENEATRKHARSAVDLSVALQHKRTATFRDAALCLEATTAAVNVIAIISGRRDPQ